MVIAEFFKSIFLFQSSVKYNNAVSVLVVFDNKPADSTVTIAEDLSIQLEYDYKKEKRNIYRLLKARIDKTGEEIYFLSNAEYMICGWWLFANDAFLYIPQGALPVVIENEIFK